ncbi:hypothetical protein Geob_3841 [Geotalea daltonii FRC-32]|uniref:Uncharacterized protein n=1 Tax=Geotalea daltonii (strain DSM 22248 / JCM 15807 / FRC-32) TaxID=316067 RepID=A0A068EZ54_GEODF|nr:hypothetical protein Geob_3841 [Geotalea daltonii FRC-32]
MSKRKNQVLSRVQCSNGSKSQSQAGAIPVPAIVNCYIALKRRCRPLDLQNDRATSTK